VIGVAVTFAIAGVLVFALARKQMRAQFDDSLIDRATALTALIEQEGNSIETDLGREETGREFHQLWHSSGKVLRRSRSLETDLARLAPGVEEVVLPDGRPGKQATIVFQPHQDTEDGPPGPPMALTFALARDTADVDAAIGALGRVLVLVGLAATLLAVALLVVAVRFGLQPARELATSIAELRESNLAARLDAARTPAELRPVVERLNDLLKRVEGAFARERELTAEVAHELRTPMAGLRATIELALDRERTSERYRTALADCLAICVQTERMVESLLSLARLDAGSIQVQRSTVEVDVLVRDAIARHLDRATSRRLAIDSELAATTASTDPEKLRVIVDNLLDNAVSYADEGGMIRVALAEQRITIENTGCTIEDATKVFDRFWRGDRARSSGTHAGIGLALCRKLVDLLGGSIAARVEDRRFIVVVSLTSDDVVDRSTSRT
jgi:two-component system, OmpR family, heavy metal sensor histidine kinase CusS